MRQPLVMGNWKLNGSRASVTALLEPLVAAPARENVEVVVCPTYLHVMQAVEICAGAAVSVGAQDCSHADSGAYTGEVAAAMLADAGCRWVIVGHSERRQYHSESDVLIAAKIAAARDAGLTPVLCVGETREERESLEAEAVVAGQLRGGLLDSPADGALVVAYEPVWAIGTGLTASPAQAQEMHAFIRLQLAELIGSVSIETRILYGGSVKPGNAAELFGCPDIDGALVGGASLVAEDFLLIADAAAG